jgi:hypothetical protein
MSIVCFYTSIYYVLMVHLSIDGRCFPRYLHFHINIAKPIRIPCQAKPPSTVFVFTGISFCPMSFKRSLRLLSYSGTAFYYNTINDEAIMNVLKDAIPMHMLYICVCVYIYICIYKYAHTHLYIYISSIEFSTSHGIDGMSKLDCAECSSRRHSTRDSNEFCTLYIYIYIYISKNIVPCRCVERVVNTARACRSITFDHRTVVLIRCIFVDHEYMASLSI